MAKTKLHFPGEYFVGIRANKDIEGDKYPLGFATPNGTDAAALKRIKSVKSWVGGDYYKKLPNGKFITIKNEPIEGFRITDAVTRYDTNMQWWRIQDPRGFEVEISSNSLSRILLCSGINGGIIEGKCLYARSGSKNDLIPEHAPEYQEILEATIERHTPKAFIKPENVLCGQLVKLKERSYGKTDSYYIGRVSVEYIVKERGPHYNSYYDRELGITRYKYNTVATKLTTRYLLLEKDARWRGKLQAFLVGKPEITEVLDEVFKPTEVGDNLKYVCDNFEKYEGKYGIDFNVTGLKHHQEVEVVSMTPLEK